MSSEWSAEQLFWWHRSRLALPLILLLLIYSPAVNAAVENSAAAADTPVSSRAHNELLSPVQLQDKYSGDGISGMPASTTLTLHGAVEEACQNNRDVREGALQVARFKWDYLAAQTNRLPHIRAVSYLSQQTVNSTLIPAQANSFVFASAMLPVTQQYRFGLEAKIVKVGEEIARLSLRKSLDDTKAQVKAAYYKVVLDQSHLDNIEISLKYLNELAVTVGNQVKDGRSLKVDELEVEAKVAQTQLDQTKARDAFNIDLEKFNHLLGRSLHSSVNLDAIPEPDAFEANVGQAEDKAISARPEIQQANYLIKQIQMKKKIELSRYIPDVSIGVVYISLNGYNNEIIPKNILAPGLFITWDGIDWGHKAFIAKALSKNEQSAVLAAQNTRDEVLIDLHSQLNKLREAREGVKVTRFARSVAAEKVRVTMNRYKYTSDRLADALEAQASLSEANKNYHQALLSFWDARAEFERAIGE